jgi:GT2 family glycosyltransferase
VSSSLGPKPSVSIVIVNWNSGELLRHCLDSVRRSDAVGSGMQPQIVVVDNGSSDDSLGACNDFEPVSAIRNGSNLGFGHACNIGASAASGEVLLFLNPDCEVRPGSIERCLAELRSDDVGVCGVALVDERGVIARSCHRFPRFPNFAYRILGLHLLPCRFGDGAMADWDHSQDADVDHVIGAFYAIRRDLFERLGGFDERFFVYLEDLDLSLRVHQAGYRIRFLAAPASFHVGGGVSRSIKAQRLFYATRSRILYAYKHFPRWQARLHLGLTLCLEPFTRAMLALARGSHSALQETCTGFAMVWRDLPATLRIAHRP